MVKVQTIWFPLKKSCERNGTNTIFPFHYLERDGGNVEIFGGKPIAQLLDSAGDLVKVHSLRPGEETVK